MGTIGPSGRFIDRWRHEDSTRKTPHDRRRDPTMLVIGDLGRVRRTADPGPGDGPDRRPGAIAHGTNHRTWVDGIRGRIHAVGTAHNFVLSSTARTIVIHGPQMTSTQLPRCHDPGAGRERDGASDLEAALNDGRAMRANDEMGRVMIDVPGHVSRSTDDIDRTILSRDLRDGPRSQPGMNRLVMKTKRPLGW